MTSAAIVVPFPAKRQNMHADIAALQAEFTAWRVTLYDDDGNEVVAAVHSSSGAIFAARWTNSGWGVYREDGVLISMYPSLKRALRYAMS